MKRHSVLLLTLALLTAATSAAAARADQWLLPKKEKYYSANKKFYLEVTPKKLESQLKFFEDKVEGRTDAGPRNGVKDNRPRGAFYARAADGGYSRTAEFPLVNEVSPVKAVVSDRGDYVVTFDNWHAAGYGDDVVVIYRADGALIKKFGLADLLSGGDIEMLPRTVSSVWWGGEHYIDAANGLLVLKMISNRKALWEEGAEYQELKIKLASGSPVEPKRDILPQPRIFGSVAADAAHAGAANTPPDKPECTPTQESFDSADVTAITSEQLFAGAPELTMPPYPPIAKAAHVEVRPRGRDGGLIEIKRLHRR